MKANELNHSLVVSTLTSSKRFEEGIVYRFYLLGNLFCAIPITVAFVSETESVSRASVSRWYCSIDEKHSIIDVMFLA